MGDKEVKGLFAVIITVCGYIFHCITELVIVLAFMMIIDYVTGVAAAFVRKDIESRKSLIGVIKKLGYMVLLVTAFFIDYIIIYLAENAGIKLPVAGLFGVATCCWLIGTEGISILENLHTIGVPFPPFLKGAFKKLQSESLELVKTKQKKG